MKKFILVFTIAIITLLILFCGKKESPEHFEKLINNMIETANEKDIEDFMDFFSTKYKDEYGANYLLIKKIVETHFERYERFEVAYEDLSVFIFEDEQKQKTAKVDLEIIVTGVKNGILSKEIIGSSGHFDYINLTFRKSGINNWKIVKIEGLNDKIY